MYSCCLLSYVPIALLFFPKIRELGYAKDKS